MEHNSLASQYNFTSIIYFSKQQLFRRKRKTCMNDRQNNGPGNCFGYRLMHQKRRSMGYTIDKERV